MPLSITALSRRNVARIVLQRGPDYPEVLADNELGGTEDPTDRRLVLDIGTLEALIEVARSSVSQRVVLHHLGLRVQLLRDRTTGHTWEHLTLIGSKPAPESSSLFRGSP